MAPEPGTRGYRDGLREQLLTLISQDFMFSSPPVYLICTQDFLPSVEFTCNTEVL